MAKYKFFSNKFKMPLLAVELALDPKPSENGRVSQDCF